MTHTVNLPVNSINTIINIDDPRVVVPIEELVESFKTDGEKTVRSMYSTPNVEEKIITYDHDISYITKLTKEPIGNTYAIKYFKLHIKYFPSEKEVDIILPSFVKLFSRTAKSYVPVEFARKSDILTSYTNDIVQILSNEPIEDYTPTEYYSVSLNSYKDNMITFYLDGILCTVYYNNFNLKETSDEITEPGEINE
jgi:hypothetical protein